MNNQDTLAGLYFISRGPEHKRQRPSWGRLYGKAEAGWYLCGVFDSELSVRREDLSRIERLCWHSFDELRDWELFSNFDLFADEVDRLREKPRDRD